MPARSCISDGPIVTRELLKAAEIWQRGIARDLAQSVGTKLAPVVKSQAPDPALPAPGCATRPPRSLPTRQRPPSRKLRRRSRRANADPH